MCIFNEDKCDNKKVLVNSFNNIKLRVCTTLQFNNERLKAIKKYII